MSKFKDGDIVVCVDDGVMEFFDQNTGYGELKKAVFNIQRNKSYKVFDADVSNGIKLEGMDTIYHTQRFMLLGEWRLKKINRLLNV